ncbi:serine hydrolase domain-containing protein [Hymenobacter chitinivorans]|uniref:CubicO group peptidase (Beta-lactamase class C family) n=1 Tax=Hymenobacter chitinivorans DSM 11115 TaxID=1121954 RepID=A0A2M9BPS8_9BACT|nr:serine hydrolase domain-containing protein [Hymenobacter chitinivorans]PJJ59959.1 CubicO group peptidase (beta-lactamase class C family) [Hymenobacter chitinivorans DSM 11115]
MKTTTWLAALCAGLSLTTSAMAQPTTTSDSVDAFVRARMQQLRIPGLQLAVVHHGKIVKLGEYGLANVQDSVPVTRRTIFPINSITKAFTGVAVMQLAEAGKLDVGAPIGQYLQGLPAAWQGVTIRQLLTHTSGLPDIMPDDTQVTADEQKAAWAAVQTKPLEAKPGEKFSYNQTNYLLVGKLIDQLSGKPFTQFIEERQIQAAGLRRTTFGDALSVVPHSARGYSYFFSVDGELQRTKELHNMFEVFAPMLRTAAGLNSTAEEMAAWVLALQQGKLLQPASLTTLWTPARLTNGTTAGFSKQLNGYALGWPTVARPEHRAVAPVGGGRSTVFLYPDDDLAVVVLTNLTGANPDRFVDELASYYVPDMRLASGFGLPPALRSLHNELRKRGFDHALELVRQQQKKNPGYQLPEAEVNAWGYNLLRQNQARQALEIFKLNVSLYPKSANTYDSLAETYQELGNKPLAAKNYQQVLKLDPQNRNAAAQLKALQ